jgi:hypothetical protein
MCCCLKVPGPHCTLCDWLCNIIGGLTMHVAPKTEWFVSGTCVASEKSSGLATGLFHCGPRPAIHSFTSKYMLKVLLAYIQQAQAATKNKALNSNTQPNPTQPNPAIAPITPHEPMLLVVFFMFALRSQHPLAHAAWVADHRY